MIRFEISNEGPVPAHLIAGFDGGEHIVRVVDVDPDEWVDVAVHADRSYRLLGWSDEFSDELEAREWLMNRA